MTQTRHLDAKTSFSNLVADADLDIGARAILTTDLSMYQLDANQWILKNRAKTMGKGIYGATIEITTETICNDYKERIHGHGIAIDGLLLKDNQVWGCDALMPQNKDKVASAILRHSIDAAEVEAHAAYTQITNKTFTFTHGIKGVLRVKGFHDAAAGKTIYSEILKDGAGSPLATPQSIAAGGSETWSDDITVDWAPGTTLNLFGKQTPDGDGSWSNFRVYYDDGTGFSAVAVAVTGAD